MTAQELIERLRTHDERPTAAEVMLESKCEIEAYDMGQRDGWFDALEAAARIIREGGAS